MESEITLIKKSVNEFFSKNHTKYEIFSCLKNKLVNLSADNYKDSLKFIQDNKKVFFKDHPNSVLFVEIVILSGQFQFKILELYLDILIHFQTDLRNAYLTENEIIEYLVDSHTLYYLLTKNFFSIKSIVDISFYNSFIFIYFYPEILEYDPEYASKRENHLLSKLNDQEDSDDQNNYELELFNFVKHNAKEHIKYRKLGYHPSTLHKSIREDDIFTFQSILSKNNIDVNYTIKFSYYERTQNFFKDQPLIEIAAIYGSVNIFKYLWMHDGISFDGYLLLLAYFGGNFEIIHLCEKKCHSNDVCSQLILMNRQDLLDYYLDNYEDDIKEDLPQVTEGLKNYEDDEDDAYKKLGTLELDSALLSFHYDIIKSCLPKIVFILRNVIDESSDEVMFILNVVHDLDFFRFFFRFCETNLYRFGSV